MAGLAKAFGSGAMTNGIHDCIEDADTIFVIGTNTTENHPVMGYNIKRQVEYFGKKLVVADPRKIELTKYADVWLRQRCGSDVALLNGLMNYIITHDMHDKKFIEERTENFDKLWEVVKKFDLETTSKLTGIEQKDIAKAAELIGGANTASLLYAMGITQHTTGTDNVLSCANLQMITGNMGKPGGGVNPLRGQNNVQGACDMGGLPNVFPAYQKVIDEGAVKKFMDAWSKPNWKCTVKPKVGLTILEMFEGIEKKEVRGLYIMGENPMVSDPNIGHIAHVLNDCEFTVVQDIFLTETAQFAHVVLPACAFAEKDGTFTNSDRRVQFLNKAVQPPGVTMDDWKIISEIATRMGYEMKYKNTSEIFDELASLAPSYGGLSHERIINENGLCWPCPTPEHPGTPILHVGKFAKGLGSLNPVDFKEPAELPDSDYPLILTTGRILYHFHTATMTGHSKALKILGKEPFVEVNPALAEKMGIKEDDEVKVATRRGELKIKARITDMVDEKTIFIPFHFAEAAANILTNDAKDPVAKIPEYKVCAASLKTLVATV